MSRTDNTMPYKIQEEDARYSRKRYPDHIGGIYKRINRRLRKWWRADRRQVHVDLHMGREPEPTRPRNFCKWDYW